MGNCCSDEKAEKKHFIVINSNNKNEYRNAKLMQQKEKEFTKTSLSIETNSQSVSDCSINGDIQDNSAGGGCGNKKSGDNNREIMKRYQFVFENNLKLPKTKKRAKSKCANKK